MSFNFMAADGHWLLHRAYSSASKAPPEAQPRVVARQILGWAFTYALEAQASHFVMAFDGSDNFRKQLYPLYKSSRITMIGPDGQVLSGKDRNEAILLAAEKGEVVHGQPDPVYDEAKSLTLQYLKAFNVNVISQTGFEADDIMAALAHHATKNPKIRKVLLYTRDKDMIGGLCPKSVQVCPEVGTQPRMEIPYESSSERIQEIVGPKAVNWTPEMFRAYQVLVGDPSDDVPQLLSSARAISIVERAWAGYGSLSAWLNEDEHGQVFARDNREDLKLNVKLVIMDKGCLPTENLDEYRYVPPSAPPSDVYAPGAVEHWKQYLTWKRVSAGNTRTLFG